MEKKIIGFRSIDSGDVTVDGEQIVLNARADDGEAAIYIPAEEAGRISILLLDLMAQAQRVRGKSGFVESIPLGVRALEIVPDPQNDRDILTVIIGNSPEDVSLDLAFPRNKLADWCSEALRVLAPAQSSRDGNSDG